MPRIGCLPKAEHCSCVSLASTLLVPAKGRLFVYLDPHTIEIEPAHRQDGIVHSIFGCHLIQPKRFSLVTVQQ